MTRPSENESAKGNRTRYSSITDWLSLANREPHLGAMCLGLLMVAILSPLAFLALSDLRFLIFGQVVEAKIIASPMDVQTKFGSRPQLRYEYTDLNHEMHIGEEVLDAPNMVIGDLLKVRYLRQTPERSRTSMALWQNWPAYLLGFLGLVALVASIRQGIKGLLAVHRKFMMGSPSEAATDPP